LFAIIALTEMDPASLDGEQLDHMVSVVRQSAGFVRGYWGRNTHDATAIRAVVMFDSRENAEALAGGIRGALANASVDVIEIIADA
jgi:hypothetical protein